MSRVSYSIKGVVILCLIFIVSNTYAKKIELSNYLDGKKIKVACVGNSVTFGAGIKDRAVDSYPAELQRLLGDKFDVQNFGKSGATLLSQGHRPYIEQEEYKKAIDFNPEIVVIHLGLNDTDPRSWEYQGDFIKDYVDLINRFKSGENSPEVWICSLSPVLPGHKRFNSGTRDWFWKLQDRIETIARTQDVGFIDLHSSLYHRPDLLPDNIHPNEEGAKRLADCVYSGVTGDFGGLSISPIYANGMVLQRGMEIPVKGVANEGATVTVKFAGQTLTTTADQLGDWSVEFPKMREGRDFTMSIESEGVDIKIEDILIGEVWLASGQSNMSFELSRSDSGKEDYKKLTNSDIRLFSMVRPNAPRAWSDSLIETVRQGGYFTISDKWEELSPESSKMFSAVAWYFAVDLHDKLDVPIGVICNSVGGSTTQGWIDRKSIEMHPQLNQMLNGWWRNDYTQPWAQGRALENLGKPENPAAYLHQFMPAYLYETGVEPLVGYPIKGVIWYQGESNADKVDMHETMFTTLVDSWREAWGYNFPFYYVQLSSLNRQTWPEFRDSQRELLSVVDNSGMAVSSDVGDKTDVHPTNKKPVGQRLALIAEAKSYGLNVEYSGPMFRGVSPKDGGLLVSFDHSKGLSTSDGEAIRSFEVAGEDMIFHKAEATITKRSIYVESKDVEKPLYVRYGWTPYTDSNLINGAGLPTSTFTNIDN